jgi:hypothetical protein
MRCLRHFVRTQWRGGVLAVYVAYSLAVQGLMASVGLGMAAGAAPGPEDFVLCGAASHQGEPARDPQAPAPHCPFCFVAAQSAGLVATAGVTPAFPAYASLSIGAVSPRRGDGTSLLQVRYTHGEPRAPPGVSV